ncbi:MAG: hypothetical protein RIB53_04185 [Roseitalea porphyridii]
MPKRHDDDLDDVSVRLLPGDKAPGLRLSIPLNRDRLPAVRFDRLSVVVLLNAGCGTCMRALERVCELGAAHQVPCYGIGVMVQNVEATKERMAGRAPTAILAIEEPPSDQFGLSRGWVTRRWLEPSGQEGVPAAFIVDGGGTVVWMSHPDGIEAVLPKMLDDGWDVEAARQSWRSAVPGEAVGHLLVVRNLTDAAIAGDAQAAIALINEAERKWPGIVRDKAYGRTKLTVLADNPDHHEAALAHYKRCVEAFGGDRDYQLGLAAWVLEKRLPEAALRLLVACLISHEPAQDILVMDEGREAMMRQWLNALLADALIRLDRHGDALLRIDRAEALLQSPAIPQHTRAEAKYRLDEIMASLRAV